MRRFLSVLVALSVAGGVALAATGDPIVRHTPADMAKARSIVLKRTDVGPGWVQSTSSNDSDPPVRCSYYRVNESGLVETGKVERTFTRGAQLLGVEAQVMRTAGDVATSWRRNAKPAYARCLAEVFKRELVKAGATVRVLAAAPMAFPSVAPRTAAWRMRFEIVDGAKKLPLTIEAVVLARGRVISSLVSTYFVDTRPPASELVRLAKLLSARSR